MPKPEREFEQPPGAWEQADGAVRGIWTRTLADDPETGAYTGLLRYEPGVDTSPIGTRVHEYWEEVYILTGDLTDLRLGKTFTAGMYACRPPGMAHGPWRTGEGALMLEIRYNTER
ncbi:MAG TPA: cupin domain-containing protein [Chloroflexota bacterium]|nr:cupin domain-containing protein [Chloroflexota bacterium]